MDSWFANPLLLWTLLASPVASGFFLVALIRRNQLTSRLANRFPLRRLALVSAGTRRWKAFCITLSLSLLAIAAAGPQWGIDPTAQHRKGRDVIIVLDLSRSMSAEQPSRRELAVRALRNLADKFEEHGGNRVALVAFAARAELFFPLTQDYDHLRYVLGQIDDDDTPKLSAENVQSGTRIGAAIKLALDSSDPASTNRPVVVLISDGDDPAGDEEWRQGIDAAKAKKIALHTVGIGDPTTPAPIPSGKERLMFEGSPVTTMLQEVPLQELARATGGEYLTAHAQNLPLGTFVQRWLDVDDMHKDEVAENALPVYQLRYPWFLMPAILLLGLAFWLREGPQRQSAQATPAKRRAA